MIRPPLTAVFQKSAVVAGNGLAKYFNDYPKISTFADTYYATADPDKIFSGLELQYQSSVKTLERHNAKGYLIANWTLFTRELIRGVEFSASIYNLFDTRYGFPGAEEHAEDIIPQDGRTFRLTLGYRF